MIIEGFSRILANALSPTGPNAQLSILIYHRVLPQRDPLFPNETTAERFDLEMKALKSVFNILSLSEAIERLKSGTLPSRAACITFDDGYADNADFAIPILKSHNLTATFFIATKFLNGGIMFNDVVIESIRSSDITHADLRKIDLGTYNLDDWESKSHAVTDILGKIKYLSPIEREDKVHALSEILGTAHNLPDNLMMTNEQVANISTNNMEVGGHTYSHPILAKLDNKLALSEIINGKDALQELTGRKVTLFAYPNGKPGIDYLPEQVELVKKAGFMAAVTTQRAACSVNSDIFQLPRFTPWGKISTFCPKLVINLLQS